ncbi:hypothetical protein CC86DRAFT_382144 [Ophiobolus disseminans]|uniref:Uncharacterized protein n=1 Tax=Ophiobolus disseminans TaxID=1469910 RepID=A0A6A7A1Y4_9PLEO|nr:hypothetical protein CC86DRAFT_382144 [Ophiobolus disseminans]
MHYSYLLSATLAALSTASPAPLSTTHLSAAKRAPTRIQLLDGSYLTESAASSSPLSRRKEADKISSCGPKSGWMPVADHDMHLDVQMWGYQSAVKEFCHRAAYGLNLEGSATPVVVGAGRRIQYTIRWQNEKAMQDNIRGARVGLKGAQPGHVLFEVNNKRSKGDYTMIESDCNIYLMHMAIPGQDCYGSKNADTKGGTWQMEENKLTFNAFPVADSSEKNIVHDEFRK